ncbi:hypothetical protein GCM10028804_59140 [Larkinella terrae]
MNGDLGLLCTINISKRDYTGESTELRPGGISPLVLDKQSTEPDNLFAPIMATVAEFNLVTDDSWQLSDLYSDDDRTFKVEVTQEIGLETINLFTGFVAPFDAREPYQEAPYPVRFTATDGLGALKDVPFNIYPTEQPFVLTFDALNVLKTCLAWVGYMLPVSISINTVEYSMLVAGERPDYPADILSQFKIDTHLFLTDTGIQSCYEVLTKLLTVFNASVVQDRGQWRVIRKDEYPQYLSEGGNIPFSVFSSFVSTDHTADLHDAIRTVYKHADAIPLRGSQISIQADRKKLTVNYDYGNLRNELVNGDFRSALDGWTQNGPAFSWTGFGTEDEPYGVKADGLTNNYINQEDTVWLRKTIEYPARGGNEDLLTFSFTYVNINTVGAKVSVMATVQGKGVFFLQSDGTWLPNNPKVNYYIFKDNVRTDIDGAYQPKPTRGEKVEIEMSAVPGRGNYRIDVLLYRGRIFKEQDHVPSTPSPYTIYRDVKITRKDPAQLDVKGEQVKAEAPGSDRKRKADELSIVLGDQSSALIHRNVPVINIKGQITGYVPLTAYYPRYGALLRLDGTPTEKWIPYGADVDTPGNFQKIQRLCAKGRVTMTARQAISGDLDLVVVDTANQMVGPCDILRLTEIKNSDQDEVYALSLTYRHDVKANRLKIKPLEILSVAGVAVKNYWQTADGAELMEDSGEIPAAKSPYIGALNNPGKIREEINRQSTGIGHGFAYDPAKGRPVTTGTGTLDFGSIRKQIITRLYK